MSTRIKLGIVLLAGTICWVSCTQQNQNSSEAEKSLEVQAPLSEQEGLVKLDDIKGWVRSTTTWADPVIPVCWESAPLEMAGERGWVQAAVEAAWDVNSAVNFTGWDECEPHAPNRSRGIRIAVTDGGAMTAGLGNVVSGVQNGMHLNFRFASWNSWCAASDALRESCIRANAVHEFGHALSFAHEHDRHDRPDSCTDRRQGNDGDLILTPWDPDSVMNYCNDRRLREGGVLSAGDIASVQTVYGLNPPSQTAVE